MKRKITYQFLTFAFCLLPFALRAQFPYQEVVNSTGHDTTVGAMHLSYSVGEPVIETFGPSGGSVDWLTQGFQQPPPCPTLDIANPFFIFPNNTICAGSNVTISPNIIGTATNYLWSDGSTTSSIIVYPTLTTVYSFTVYSGTTSCDADSVTIIVSDPVVNLGADTTQCGGTVTLNAGNPGSTYLWSDASTNQTLTVSTTGTYTVTVTDMNNCMNTATVAVTVSAISVDAGADQTICFGFTAQLDATVSSNSDVSYLWSPASSLNNAFVANPSANPDSSTVYFVEVYNSDMCYAKDSVTVSVVRSVDCLVKCDEIYNGITPNGDGDNEEWFINGIISFPENNVNIFNRWGTNVWSKPGYDNKDVVWKGTNQQGQDLPDGTYYYVIKIHTQDGTKTCSGWVEITR